MGAVALFPVDLGLVADAGAGTVPTLDCVAADPAAVGVFLRVLIGSLLA